MRYAALLLLLMTGCAAKRVEPKVSIPPNCILGGLVNKDKCDVLDKDKIVCSGVVIKIACVEVNRGR